MLFFSDQTLKLINPGLGDKVIIGNTDTMLNIEPTDTATGTGIFLLNSLFLLI